MTIVLHTMEKIISDNVHLRLVPSPHDKGSPLTTTVLKPSLSHS
jgi:hypothetical protein